MISNLDDGLMHELTFLTALGCYYTGQQDRFLTLFKTAFFSAHSINSCYATICKNYVSNHLSTTLAEDLNIFSGLFRLISFSPKVPRDVSSMGDGTYDFFFSQGFHAGWPDPLSTQRAKIISIGALSGIMQQIQAFKNRKRNTAA